MKDVWEDVRVLGLAFIGALIVTAFMEFSPSVILDTIQLARMKLCAFLCY
jgi:hypothetical protein